jgi:hypothetical protein
MVLPVLACWTPLQELKEHQENKLPYENKTASLSFLNKRANFGRLTHSYFVFQINLATGTDELLMAVGRTYVSKSASDIVT